MAHLRFSVDHAVGPCLYTRGDGTLSYFFTVDRVMALAAAAGLVCASCEYHTVFNTNRKSGVQVRNCCCCSYCCRCYCDTSLCYKLRVHFQCNSTLLSLCPL